MPYTVIDHTADTGIQVWARDLADLFTEAARAMFEQITDTTCLDPVYEQRIQIEGIDRTDLLINWLRELLFLFTAKHFLAKRVRIEHLEETRVTGRAAGEYYDPQKHDIETEIKAVTYYGAEVKAVPDGFEITVVFDV